MSGLFRLNPNRNLHITNWNLKEAKSNIIFDNDISADNPTIPIFFFSNQKYSMLSNYALTPLEIDGRDWQTVEHYFQAMKSENFFEQETIRFAPNPKDAKKIASKINIREDWDNIKYSIMLKALRVKFREEEMKNLLLSTKERLIYSDNPFDLIWGTGKLGNIGSGQNLLGEALMEIREELKKCEQNDY
jgi:ribA/ribD-fused uncharacterized protein